MTKISTMQFSGFARSYRLVMVLTVVALFFIFPAASPVSAQPAVGPGETGEMQDDEAPRAQEEREIDTTPPEIEAWRETLLFGINSAVAELLPRLTREQREELAPEVIDLFNTANDRQVLHEAVRYLQAMELSDGHDRALQLVREYFDRPSELITTVLAYLRETGATTDEETTEILQEIARINPPARAVAAVRLYAANTDDIEQLLDLYREPAIPEDVQGQILVELGTRGDPRAFDFVSEIIGEDEEATTMLQRFAIDTLGKLGDEKAIPIIMRQLDSSDAMTRAYAVNALAGFTTPETDRALMTSLRDQFWRVRVAALRTVAERKLEEALPAVLYMMRRDPERPVRMEAIRTVGALDEPRGWEALLERMKDPRGNLEERGAMVGVALEKNPKTAVPAILEIVQEEWDKPNSRILDTIGRSVSTTESEELEPVVEQLLNHPNHIIRIYGVRSAGRNGFTRYRSILESFLDESSHQLLKEAAERALQQF